MISYSGANSSAVKEKVKQLGSWATYFDNQYFLYSNFPILSIRSSIDSVINTGVDKLLIVDIDLREANGWLPKTAWDWIGELKQKAKYV